ncbi:acyl-CoA synthetase [Bacillus sp. DX1.1]|uniref:acyl-CoA synthetase n=1 Tax=unclassified Bacillus (in: firmicutes) TaxID=185979 RepID=UPI0025701956|nr:MULTISPECIES: acyl-CoA synthetase [unclassified Bacillus (in: firmicutes)]MDM5155765.1 acyl-CoA synthetase [Bacillus sp. DX1.1]WJE80064.1 acyl-CoA synthetase [Bacillus sp. DX3.1]
MGITTSYEKHACVHPNKVAIKENDRVVTYKEWYSAVCQVANWLTEEKSMNKTIAILLENQIEFLQIFAGAAMAGWVCVPLDLKWKHDELDEKLKVANPSIVITEQYKMSELPKINGKVFTLNEWAQILCKRSNGYDSSLSVDDLPFYMGFTSGSTGKAKAFLRAQQSWVKSFDCNVYDFHMKNEDSVLLAGTFVHSLFLYGAMSALYLGQTVHIVEKFIPNRVLSILEQEQISVMYTVPTMLEALYKEERAIEQEVKIISSGAKWEAEAKRNVQRMFPYAKRYEFYGASELSFVTALTDEENERKASSVGKPCHNVQVRICNGSGQELQPGEVGTVYVKSEQFFIGYLQDGELSYQETEDGWMTVQDIGYRDDEGFLYIVGREKNMILYGGINIFPEEVESVLLTHPNVEEVVIVGVQDVYWGERPVAMVRGRATKQELKRFCLQQLSSYKIPKEWYFVDEIPYTSSGKIAREVVRDRIGKQEKVYE